MKSVDLLTVHLKFRGDKVTRPYPHLLRGAIAGQFPGSPLFHQHDGDRLLYQIPRIQYRWDEDGPMLVGLEEGARELVHTNWIGMELNIDSARVIVDDALVAFRRHEIRMAPRLLRYRLVTPWLPFSTENYRVYQDLDASGCARERDRLAVAGLLISLKALGVQVQDRLYVAVEDVEPVVCPYKGVEMLGFFGRVLANIDLPPGLAFGRSVSHGYGWLMPEEPPPPVPEQPPSRPRSSGSRSAPPRRSF